MEASVKTIAQTRSLQLQTELTKGIRNSNQHYCLFQHGNWRLPNEL